MSESHRGWFRVEESAVRKLRDTYDSQSVYRLALAVYVTLCRVSNLEGQDTFTRRIASIAHDAGLSYNAAVAGLDHVRDAGLLKVTAKTVEGSRERAPSEYHLVRMSPIEWGTSPTENGRLPKSENSQVLPRVSKNCTKNAPKTSTKREGLTPRTRFVPPTLEQAEAEAINLGIPKEEAQAFVDHHETRGWILKGGQKMKSWKAAMRTWKRTYLRIQSQRTNSAKDRNYTPVGGTWSQP